jgi:hypothetical protein
MSQVIDDLEKETGDARDALKQPQLRKNAMHLGAILYIGGPRKITQLIEWLDINLLQLE